MAALLIGLVGVGIGIWNAATGNLGTLGPAGQAAVAGLAVASLYLVFLGASKRGASSVTTHAPAPQPLAPTPVPRVETAPVAAPKPEPAPPRAEAEVTSFLSLLQQKGRFIDFVMDDITSYPDEQVGAAARIVHQGCSEVIREYFDIVPLQEQSEGASVTVDTDYDAARYRLVGRVVGRPPFKGVVVHRGWKTNRVALPRPASSAPATRDVIAPAEIEVN